MKLAYNERLFWGYESDALNSPQSFKKDLPRLRKTEELPEHAYPLLEAVALISTGALVKAGELLQIVEPKISVHDDHFLQSKYYLIKKRWHNFVSDDLLITEELISLAEKHQKHCSSKALECEVLLHRCHHKSEEREFTSSEDMLQKAINLAMQADIKGLIVDAYIIYAMICHINQLADQANQELQLLFEFPDLEHRPFNKVIALSQVAINQAISRKPKDAENTLRSALEIATKHKYGVLNASLYLNLGIFLKSQRRLDEAVEQFEQCIMHLERTGAMRSNLATKAIHNKANTLSLTGKLEEARDLLFGALTNARALQDKAQESIVSVNLADTLIELKEYSSALELIDTAIAYFTQVENYNFLQNAYLCKARYYQEREEFKDAFICMEHLYEVSRMYFQENFQNQSKKFQNRINNLRYEYLMIKSNCQSTKSIHINGTPMELIGRHPQFTKAISAAMQAARHPLTNVMIFGESGTGKELLARLIHSSEDFAKPFVAINASAIPANLIESELFGHVKGAFTGAVAEYKGKFLLADGGTLFLDEISEMPLDTQAKLLRAIEYQSITPVGSNKEVKVNCRIICATNKDLKDLIKRNQFRLDLYYRLNKIEVTLPSLKERMSDLELLVNHFIKLFAKDHNQSLPTIGDDFLMRLRTYSFPGNIRELANLIERIFILSPSLHWDAKLLEGLCVDIPETVMVEPNAVSQQIQSVETNLIQRALAQCGGMQKEAARLLGMTESTLSRRIKKLGIAKQ